MVQWNYDYVILLNAYPLTPVNPYPNLLEPIPIVTGRVFLDKGMGSPGKPQGYPVTITKPTSHKLLGLAGILAEFETLPHTHPTTQTSA